jgi:hypothetical protein
MMLVGRLSKDGAWWAAECAILGAFTQGKSRKEAMAMLGDCIETQVDRRGFKTIVTEIGSDRDGVDVLVESNLPAVLTSQVLKCQRDRQRLTIAEVAKALGFKSARSYARYEEGRREPSLRKFRELLRVVAPDVAITVTARNAG